MQAQSYIYKPPFQMVHNLMSRRVQTILLVSSPYDYFILEEDGQVNEQIIAEYLNMNFRFAVPRIIHAKTGDEAFQILENRQVDLVILMGQVVEIASVDFGRDLKEKYPHLPLVMLVYNIAEFERYRQLAGDLQHIDRIFFWFGDSSIFLTIFKHIEDRLNVDNDIKIGNVRVIIVVEDSFRYYSMFLPQIYKEVFNQTQSLINSDANELEKLLQMRTRPKILLAETYNDAIALFNKYQKNVLGIISDIRFPRDNVKDPQAGFRLAKEIKNKNLDTPIALQSADNVDVAKVRGVGASFISKTSPQLLSELRKFLLQNFGFGSFVFYSPDGYEVDRAKDLDEMIEKFNRIPADSLEYHVTRNHFSHWFFARGEFDLAEDIRPHQMGDFDNDPEAMRKYLLDKMIYVRNKKFNAAIINFAHEKFDPAKRFVKIGEGSVGGKARSIAFLSALFQRKQTKPLFKNVDIFVPHSAAISTDLFDQFLVENDLKDFAIEETDDQKIVERFIAAKLPSRLKQDLYFYLRRVTHPIAVRSSSLLEDSRYQPFAGIYATYMLPNNHPDPGVRFRQLSTAIKLVYASTFYAVTKAYLEGTPFRIEEEKMGVILQRLIGRQYGRYFYPNISGVAQSYNYYPIAPLGAQDGLAFVGLGLGRLIMEGGHVLRFSPKYPRVIHQFATVDDTLRNSQNIFYALDMNTSELEFTTKNEDVNIIKLDLFQAEIDGTLHPIGSVYSPENHRIVDNLYKPGPRLITFAQILKYNTFPLADILGWLLDIGKANLGSAIEMEFAANLATKDEPVPQFALLQIRPMVASLESINFDFDKVNPDDAICLSTQALGNGKIVDIQDIIYVKPQNFTSIKTVDIAYEIGRLNTEFINYYHHHRNGYVLVGPGRWGTADHALGIPVEWSQISAAKVLIEASLSDYVIEPSQGTHFFQNITSLGIGYFSVAYDHKIDMVDWKWLDKQSSLRENQYLRWVHFESPLKIYIDGKYGWGVILKPSKVIFDDMDDFLTESSR